MHKRYVSGIFLSLIVSATAALAGTGLTYHGRIVRPDGRALEAPAVQFNIQIRSPGNESCLLYQETQILDMRSSGGIFSLELGANPTFRVAAAVDGGNSFSKIFSNHGTLNLPTCDFGNTYTPNIADGRLLYISFDDGTGPQTLSPQKVTYAPYAIEAMQLNGYTASQLLRVDSGTAPTLTAGNLVTLDELFNGTLNLNTSGSITSNGPISSSNVHTSTLRIYNGSNYVQLTAPALTSNVLFKLPSADGSADQVLKTDGAGNLSWAPQTALGTTTVNAPLTNTGTGTSPIISLPAASGSQNGYLSSTDWNTFNNKLSQDLETGKIWMGNASNMAAPVTVSGAGTLSSTGVLSLSSNSVASTQVTDGSLGVADLNFAGSMLVNTGLVVQNGSQFYNMSCGANQTLIWSVSNGWTCSNLVLSESDPKIGANTTNYLSKWNGTSLVSSGIIESSGNIGINETTPLYPLSVGGVIQSSSGGFRFPDGTTQTTAALNVAATTLNDGKIWVGNSSNKPAEVTLSGEVTITNAGVATVDKTQTAQPNKILQLDANSVANTKGVSILTNDASVYATSSAAAKTPAGGANISINNWQETNSSASYVKFNVYNSSSNDQYAYMGAVSTAGASAWVPAIVFGQGTGANSYAEAMRIHTNNNVGIGATAPATKLDVNGITRSTGFDVTATYGGSQASIRAPGAFTSYTLTLPTTVGTSGQVLMTNGTGTLSWTGALGSVSDSANLTNGKIWIGNASGKASEATVSGDATMSNSGVLTLSSVITAGSAGSTRYTPVITYDAKGRLTTVTSALVDDTTKLRLTGGTMSGDLDMNGYDLLNLYLNSGRIWVGNSTNGATAVLMSGDATLSNTGALTLASTITAGGPVGTSGYIPVITYDAKGRLTAVTSAAVNDTTKLPLAGGTMSGVLNMNGQNITNAGNITMSASKYLTLSANATNGTSAGQVWYDAGVIKYFDGSTVKSLDTQGSGIGTLNGLNAVAQTFAIGTTGNSPAFSSVTSTHTLNIPMASASGTVTAGLLSNAEYTTLNNKQSTALAAGNLWVGNASGGAQARALSGDIASISNVGLVTATKTTTGTANTLVSTDGSGVIDAYGYGLKGATSGSVDLLATATTANYTLRFPAAAPAANQVLQSDASGNFSWITALTSSSGYVNGGNIFAGNASIGLNDAYNLDFKTSNAVRMTILANGNVGMGNTAPAYKLDVTGAIRSSGEIISTYANQFRMVQGNYGSFFRNDGSNTYLLLTASADQYGSWNTLRPFTIDNASGNVQIAGTALFAGHNGSVGIGTVGPAEKLDVAGNVRATSFISTSDRRLKKNIETVEGLDKVLQLRGVRFQWRENDVTELGTIAQEVEQVFPELVITNKITGFKAVKYQGLIAPLIEATKQLNYKCEMSAEQIAQLSATVARHDQDIANLKRRLASVENENAALKEVLKSLESRVQAIENKDPK